jgi:hypothetical protein
MTHDPTGAELIGHLADERLLSEDIDNLPADVGRPETLPPSRIRGRLVGVGATLTGVTLFLGVGLIVLGAIEALTGGFSVLDGVAIVVGALLLATHWGWVHVAEATADAIEGRRNSEILARRRLWLDTIKPYTRYEVTTSVGEDGAISIVRTRHRPVRTREGGFTFVREVESREVHASDEPGAAVAERAELLRRQAAVDTQREREGFEAAADAYETALLTHGDEQQRVAARRAASEALSERINSNLRDPPLVE